MRGESRGESPPDAVPWGGVQLLMLSGANVLPGLEHGPSWSLCALGAQSTTSNWDTVKQRRHFHSLSQQAGGT